MVWYHPPTSQVTGSKCHKAAELMDSTCNTIERRFVNAGLRGGLGKVADGFTVPGFPKEADGVQNKWVGECP